VKQPEAVDLADPVLHETDGVDRVFDELRRRSGLYWNAERDAPGFWAVTRYRDATAVCRDTTSFTSTHGTLLTSYRSEGEPGAGRMLVMTDPPRHGQLRSVLNRLFTPRMIGRLGRRLEVEVRGLVEAALDAGRCDFVADIAAQVPVALISELMGVPPEDRELMHRYTSAAFSSTGPLHRSDMAGRVSAAAAHAALIAYCCELVAARRREPRDDLVSILATARIDGAPLSDEEILVNCDNLIVGGNETVRHAASGGLLALLEHPGQFARLRAEPGLLDTAVEEILRWTTPGMHILRTASADVTVSGQRIRRGEQAVVWIVSANRDDEAFERAGSFDVSRSPNRHLTFGIGEHYCLGAALARLELRVLFRLLCSPALTMERSGPARRLRSTVARGLRELPILLSGSIDP